MPPIVPAKTHSYKSYYWTATPKRRILRSAVPPRHMHSGILGYDDRHTWSQVGQTPTVFGLLIRLFSLRDFSIFYFFFAYFVCLRHSYHPVLLYHIPFNLSPFLSWFSIRCDAHNAPCIGNRAVRYSHGTANGHALHWFSCLNDLHDKSSSTT